MLTYCTVPARCSRIRSKSPSSFGRFAGRPDISDHTSGREPTALPKPSQSSKSPKPECASESSSKIDALARRDGGRRLADDYQVIWRNVSIDRINVGQTGGGWRADEP